MTSHSATNVGAGWLDQLTTGPTVELQLVQDPAGLAAMDAYIDQLTKGASKLDYDNLAGVTVLLYARISNDKEHSEAGVKRQLAFMVEWVERRGGAVAAVYVDNDTSISTVKARKRKGKRRHHLPRPEFDAMCQAADVAAAAGHPVMLLATETMRLYRTPRQFVELVEYAGDQAGAVDIVAMRGSYDLTTRQGRRDALNAAQHNFDEAEETSERLVMYCQELVRNGVVKSGRRAYGWADAETHHPTEAPVVAKALRDVAAGVPLAAIADEWEAAGVVTPYWDVDAKGPVRWSQRLTQIKNMLSNPKHGGHQAWRGQPVNMGRFTPIVAPDVWEAARAALHANDGKRGKGGGNGRGGASPFTGLLVCGRCGDQHRLQHHPGNGRTGAQWVHARKGCYMTVTAAHVEQGLWRAAVARVSSPAFLAALADDADASAGPLAELELVRAKRETVERLFNTDELSDASYLTQTRLLADREAAANAELARTAAINPVAQWLASNTLSADGATLPDHVQRNVLSLVYHLVRVHPATARGHFDPTRIEPVFVEEVTP